MTDASIPKDCAAGAAAPLEQASAPGRPASDRERELRALVKPILTELERSTVVLEGALESASPAVLEISARARRYRGKRLRAAVTLLTGAAVAPRESSKTGHRVSALTEELVTIAAIVEMIHMATLVHDDVLDHAEMRRRVPTVNALYGNQTAVLLGDWIYARAFCLSTQLEDQTCSRLLSDVTATLCQGEIEQTRARFDFDLDRARYLAMIEAKTASLYAASCELGAHYAGAGDSVVAGARAFGKNLGLAFQIVDDCLDLEGVEDVVGKSLGTDVSEGKITLPMILVLEGLTKGHRRRFEEIFRVADAPARGARRADALEALRREFDLSAALAGAYALARRFAAGALAALEPFPPSEPKSCLESMTRYVLGRRW